MMTTCITEKQITGAINAVIEPKIIAAPDVVITYARYIGFAGKRIEASCDKR